MRTFLVNPSLKNFLRGASNEGLCKITINQQRLCVCVCRCSAFLAVTHRNKLHPAEAEAGASHLHEAQSTALTRQAMTREKSVWSMKLPLDTGVRRRAEAEASRLHKAQSTAATRQAMTREKPAWSTKRPLDSRLRQTV